MQKTALAVYALLSWTSPLFAQDVSLRAPGASDALLSRLRAASSTLALRGQTQAEPQDFVAAARADYRRLLTALYEDGFFGASVSIKVNGLEVANIATFDEPTSIGTVEIAVTRGEVFRFGTTAIAPIAPETVMPETLRSGAIAQASVIKTAAEAGILGWQNAGHAKAAVIDQQITARHAAAALDVRVDLDPGPKLRFGQVRVSGNQAVDANRIIRISGLPTGEIYNPDEVRQALQRLRRTGAFASVSATQADTPTADNRLPYTISVKESKPRRIGFGIDLSSVDGLEVSSYWLHRNFGSGAQRLRVEAEISGIGGTTGGVDYRIGASFDRPAIYGADTHLFIRTELSRLDEPAYLQDKISFEVGASRIISSDLQGEFGIGYLAAREETDAFSREYTLFTLPTSATLERRDSVSNPQDGYFLKADALPFLSVDGNTAGTRVYGDARYYQTFGADRRLTLAARGQIGSVFGAQISDTPADYLFYSGGGGTVRGQSYNALGVNSTINGVLTKTGGKSFLGAQLEARYQVTDSIGLVGFYDFGQVTDDAGLSGNASTHAGAGLGLRYDTGIGPIRLDIGTPATRDDAFSNVQIYIGIGQAF